MDETGIILVVDDEKDHADGIAEAVEKCRAKTITAYNAADALEIIKNENVDVIITDLRLDGKNDGMKILEEAKKLNPKTEVILITAYATIDTCKRAIKKGACDYLVKPIDIDQLRTLVQQVSRRARQNLQAAPAGQQDFRFSAVRGKMPAMEGIFRVIRKVAPTNISVLIEGKSGTGKELLARAIHDNSPRADKPFRPINCAGFTETLLESELFGHAKGAFTGATADRKGLFEIADKGTLLLDEIGDMPLNMQAKLLRVIEDGLVTPVGSNRQIAVDVRLIAQPTTTLPSLSNRENSGRTFTSG